MLDPLILSHFLSSCLFRLLSLPSLFLPRTYTFPFYFFSAQRLIPSPFSVIFYFLPIYNSLARMFHISHLPFSRSSVSLQLSSLFFFNLFLLSPSFPCVSLSPHAHFTCLLLFLLLAPFPSLLVPSLILYSPSFSFFSLHTLLYLLHHTPPCILGSSPPQLPSTLLACSFSSCFCLGTPTSHMAY